MICNICGLEIEMDADGKWDGGHNADPITEGRCCERCNFALVIPARLREFQLRRQNGK
tara:strand:+ start:93 stop:266 length:174 start_codon:yes stop_codon:yes gene_type:complete